MRRNAAEKSLPPISSNDREKNKFVTASHAKLVTGEGINNMIAFTGYGSNV